jgi:hypothetical protein
MIAGFGGLFSLFSCVLVRKWFAIVPRFMKTPLHHLKA